MSKSEYPKIVIRALIYNEENKIFLGKSNKWGDRWIVPGGHLELGETFVECIKREVREETNLEISNIELIGIQESIFSKEFHKKRHMIFLDYCCLANNSSDIKLNDEIQEYIWIKPEEALEKLILAQTTVNFIKSYIDKKRVI
jgi:nucleoside triphosphatase